MNWPQQLIEIVGMLAWLVAFVIALGLAEIAVCMVINIVKNVKEVLK